MDMFQQRVIVVQPRAFPHAGTVIFMHGLGQSNLTWKLVVDEVLAPSLPNIKWILPQAPHQKVSMNRGQLRPSWFDIMHLPPYTSETAAGLPESLRTLEGLILNEVYAGTDARRIIVAGFSQGAALALVGGLTTLHELGGIASLSGWIPRCTRDQMVHTDPNLAVFGAHGTDDIEIPLDLAEETAAFIRAGLRAHLTFRRYHGMGHTLCDEELEDLIVWLRRAFSAS